MTVYKEEKVAQKLIDMHKKMCDDDDDDQYLLRELQEEIPSPEPSYEPLINSNVGVEIMTSPHITISRIESYTNLVHLSDFGPYFRCTTGFISPPIWPPIFGIPTNFFVNINDLIMIDSYEEEGIEDIVNALENIILTEPSPSYGLRPTEDLPYVDFHIDVFETTWPRPQNLMWSMENFLDEEPHPYIMHNTFEFLY